MDGDTVHGIRLIQQNFVLSSSTKLGNLKPEH